MEFWIIIVTYHVSPRAGDQRDKTPPTPCCLVGDSFKMRTSRSSVYLVEWSSIRETTVPYLVHHLDCLDIVFTIGTGHNREDSPSSNTLLMMVGQFHETILKEFVGPSTLSAQITGSDLPRRITSAFQEISPQNTVIRSSPQSTPNVANPNLGPNSS